MGFLKNVIYIIKSILFHLPKKWLIMIIFALVMTFGLTQVKAIDYDSTNWIQYKSTTSNNTHTWRVTADEPFYIAVDNTNSNYWSAYKMGTTDEFLYINVYRDGSLFMNHIGSKQVQSWGNTYTDFTSRGDVAFYNRDGVVLYSTTNWSNAQYLENVNTNNLTFYDYLDIKNSSFDTGMWLTVGNSQKNNRRELVLEYSLTLNGSSNNSVLNVQNGLYLYNPNTTSLRLEMGSASNYKNINISFNRKTTLTLSASLGTLILTGEGITNATITDDYIKTFYSPNPIILNGGSTRATSYKVYNMAMYDFSTSTDTVYHDYYPASYISSDTGTTITYYGFYDFVTGDFLICPNATINEMGAVTETPSIFPSEDSNAYLIMNNVKDSINGVNIMPNDINDSTGVTAGVNSIFNTIMSTFTNIDDEGEVVFPIPHTGKSITLKANYTRNMLSNNGCEWLIMFITLFWWYVISRYIIKDILKALTKIQTGKLDEVEATNIKGDML